jgi:hypothetical protein
MEDGRWKSNGGKEKILCVNQTKGENNYDRKMSGRLCLTKTKCNGIMNK